MRESNCWHECYRSPLPACPAELGRGFEAMSWDFSTEPEFEKKLEWMRTFVKEEVYPLEVLDADEAGFGRIIRSLRDEVKSQKLWATHLPPELGGQGYGQVKLGLMHEIEGATM